ncbi:unnamed protein product [Ceutorhynchus assimilis]|uniref:BPL/LPL catalytic domain-containing protein n=1 Tax=Ceutorhynchus assimilis TaxID=467358 RepID=A0A9P0DM44_9CUCU|nr:unnamed protein product [Ceutorhynchus assimilis]
MLLTLPYMYATILQWWRLGALKNKLTGTLNSNNALLVCDESIIFDTTRTRSIENLLFKQENRIAVTVVPKQSINLGSQWLYFPKDSRYFPIYFKQNKISICRPHIYILVQAVLDNYKKHQAEILAIEQFGELVAWKITENFETILRSDMDKLVQLVQCFSQRDCDMNHELKLLKIETIEVDGFAKRIIYERQFSAETTQKYSLTSIHWTKFVSDVRGLYSKIRDATKKHRSAERSREHRSSREQRKHRSKDETDASRHHKTDREHKEEKTEQFTEVTEHEPQPGTSKQDLEATSFETKCDMSHKHKEKHKHKRYEDKEKIAKEESRECSSVAHKSTEKLRKSSRTSSKEKKLVRATATCDEPTEAEIGQGNNVQPGVAEEELKVPDQNGPNSEKAADEIISPTESNGCILDRNLLKNVKPPNILVYADSMATKDNVKDVLGTILNREKYTIYDLPTTGPLTWRESTALVVVCGNMDPKLTTNLLNYLLSGGQLLCLCSDLLYSVLHTFTTAEVREHELVRFSYGKWRNVKMMHHIFCYQASPAKKQFSKDSDNASNHSSGNGSSPIAPRTPSTVEIQHGGKEYTVQVQVLGAEETWQTPSLLLASVKGSQGRAVFSQVHLEIDPQEYIDDEYKFEALKDSNKARLDILQDILSNHLELDCTNPNANPVLTPAYFLGRHDQKLNMLNETHCIKDNEMTAGDMHILFCGKDDRYDDPSRTFLPILIHTCPQNFNTVSYFETLDTKYIGRLVVYSDVLTSSQALLQHNQLTHGVAVVCRQQLVGVGRSKNKWISPPGSAPFTLQLHISTITNLGKSQGLVQHLIMVAAVKAVRRLTGNNKNIKLGIKWPNDLYIDGCVKVGGAIVTGTTLGELSSLNIGCGLNLSNSNPTTCINDVIRDVNAKTGSNIPEITHEKYFAQVFNETEKLINRFQLGDVEYFYEYYYDCWLHKDAAVTITTAEGKFERVKIVGIDDQGFLKVKTSRGTSKSVQPDGNSFDIMKGLISIKNF